MSWEKSSYTKAGAALLSESLSGGTLTITRAVSGTGVVKTDLSEETAVSGDTHELTLLSIKAVQDGSQSARKVSIQIPCADSAYIMHQIGVYGRPNYSSEDTLLFLMQDERGIEVPAASSNAEFEIEVDALLAISNRAKIDITLDPQMKALIRLMRAEIAKAINKTSIYDITLAADSWQACADVPGYPYKYTAELPAALEASVPSAVPSPATFRTAVTAGLAGVCETADGSITFWAESVPEGDIQMQVTLLGKASTSEDETTSVLGRSVLGRLTLNTGD